MDLLFDRWIRTRGQMFCGAKLPFLFSFLFSLFTGKSRGGERREKWRAKSEEWRKQKEKAADATFSFWWRRGESNPCPKRVPHSDFYSLFCQKYIWEVTDGWSHTVSQWFSVSFIENHGTYPMSLTPIHGPEDKPWLTAAEPLLAN